MTRKRSHEEEAKVAQYYEEHADDPQVWEHEPIAEPEERPIRRRAGLETTITVRFSVEEGARIRDLAKQTGWSYSDIVRKAVAQFTTPQILVESGPLSQAYYYECTLSSGRGMEVRSQGDGVLRAEPEPVTRTGSR